MSFNKNIFIAIIVSCLLSSFITFEICNHSFKSTSSLNSIDTSKFAIGSGNCDYKISRMDGYAYVRPLLSVEEGQESPSLSALKNNIINKIDEYKKAGILQSASVYLRVFKKGEWMVINDTEMYYPGSIIKVAGLLTYLRMDEATPGILNKRLSFDSPKEFIPNQTYNSQQIQLGKSYTIKELLRYMIAYSDNNATYLLNKNVDMKIFQKLFTEIGIPLKEIQNGNIKLDIEHCSMLLKVIYNSSYLSIDHSEFAAELLAQCDFREGMVKGLPPNTKIAHKFGEMGDATTRQLHETGIIYVDNAPYLLTIMTKGYAIDKLPRVIADITAMTYAEISKK